MARLGEAMAAAVAAAAAARGAAAAACAGRRTAEAGRVRARRATPRSAAAAAGGGEGDERAVAPRGARGALPRALLLGALVCAAAAALPAAPALAADGGASTLASAVSFVLHLDKVRKHMPTRAHATWPRRPHPWDKCTCDSRRPDIIHPCAWPPHARARARHPCPHPTHTPKRARLQSMASIIAQYGTATYAILFGIVFCETGLVVTPFLPGDSLLFACGAFAALGSLNLALVMGLLFGAAVMGDALNYTIGKTAGEWMLAKGVVKQSMLDKTEDFYAKYGGKTIVLARFVPIVRTFAPFVAGMSRMEYTKFAAYNVGGAALWIGLFTTVGYLFGNLPVVQHNFTLVVLGIVVMSLVPIVIEILQARQEAKLKEA